MVFDGTKNSPYVESDEVNPLNVYGKSKVQCEQFVQLGNPDALVIRTSAFFGPWDEYNFVHYVRKSLSLYETITVASDICISPTYVPDLVHASLDLAIDDEKGIWHLANKGEITWAGLAFEIADRFRLNKNFIRALLGSEMGFVARRPAYSVLGSEKGQLLPSLEDALKRYYKESETIVQLSKTA
jgi:dTDP-4-dehydrorhamnose reductase